MAEKAYRMTSNCEEICIEASELAESDVNDDYRCCGVDHKGRKCGVKMVLCRPSDKNNYFRAVEDKHIPYCLYDESSDRRRLSHFDLSGVNFDIGKFFSKIRKGQNEETRPLIDNPENGTGYDVPKDEKEKPVERVKRKANGLFELCLALQNHDIDFEFGNKKVKDLIFDRRTHNYHRTHKINNILLIVACKGKEKINNAPRRSLVLFDPFSVTENRIHFLMLFENESVRKKVGDKIFFSDKESQFLVLAEWSPYYQHPNTYVGTIEKHSQVVLLPD